jgi:hypothetical protein
MQEIFVSRWKLVPLDPFRVIGGNNQVIVKIGPVAVGILESFGIRGGKGGVVGHDETSFLHVIGFKFAHANNVGGISTGLPLHIHSAKNPFMGRAKISVLMNGYFVSNPVVNERANSVSTDV